MEINYNISMRKHKQNQNREKQPLKKNHNWITCKSNP